MKYKFTLLALAAFVLFTSAAFRENNAAPAHVPEYTADGQLKKPEDYRTWVYLSTGFDMSYAPGAQGADHHMFDNVFVNPESYESFLKTGTWPDKTTFALEARMAKDKGSINQRGNFQDTDVMATEVHVKDSRLPGGWGFFGFDENKTAKMIEQTASCYSCHQQHGAVDTTFVQFYPTLLPIAQSKGTLSAAYQKETAAAATDEKK